MLNGSNPQVNLTTQSGITENMKFWLGGFRVQPEFRVTQHVNGKHILEAYLGGEGLYPSLQGVV